MEKKEESNANMPGYISNVPWYSQSGSGKLTQKSKAGGEKPSIDTWYERGAKGKSHSKFRKGACTNCGALTHSAKDCCERPRKVGARFTGKDLQPDEKIQDIDLDYDGKHDRWNGFKPEMFEDMMQEKLLTKRPRPEPTTEKYSESPESVDPRTKTILMHNRMRKDVAGYLYNLDHNKLDYDGKSRALRNIETDKETSDNMYVDSWIKPDGLMNEIQEMEEFVQKVNAQGNDLHSIANPSQSELLFNAYKNSKKNAIQKKELDLQEKYNAK